jgi:hypothetical protein
MRKLRLLALALCAGICAHAQTTYFSKASAIDFNDVNSWGANTDGTGASPASVSNADNFVIGNGANMTLSAPASVRALYIGGFTGFLPATNAGTLTIATGNSLTVSRATGNNATLGVGTSGSFVVSGGSVTINGNIRHTSGNFSQSGGTITVDGNDAGNAATSVVTGTGIVSFEASGLILSGGTLIVVDPHVGTSTSIDYAFAYSGVTNLSASVNHTLQIGNGSSTDNTTNTAGFILEPYVGSNRLLLGNLTVDCAGASNRFVTCRFVSQTVQVQGNLTVTSGELRGPSTGTIAVAGNVVNNGTLTTTGTLAFQNGSGTTGVVAAANAQSISGTGVFRNSTTTVTANFANLTVNNSSAGGVTFVNANSLKSGANAGTVFSTLTFTNGIINTNGGTFLLSTGTANGTISYTAGGFGSGSVLGRYFTGAATGTSITGGAVPTSTGTGTFPFVQGNPVSGMKSRFFYFSRTATGATGGIFSVGYTEGAGGLTPIASVADGAYNIDRQSTANWVVSGAGGFGAGTGNYSYSVSGDGIYSPLNTNGRLMLASSVVGAHQAGTTLPNVQRITIPGANFAGTFYIGIAAADVPVTSVQSGAWENTSTWSGGVVPACGNNVVVLNTHNVTVSAGTGSVSVTGLTVNAGGTLTISGGGLTVGCSNNNNTLTNNGTLSISGGTLTVNGNINSSSGSTFSQTAGSIIVDGNDNNTIATSVATGTPILHIQTSSVTLSGGTLVIVDPHVGTAATDDAFRYNSATAASATTGHTLQLGDGVSTTAGGNTTNGFCVEPFVGVGRLMLGNVTINTVSAAGNRFVAHRITSTTGFQVLGNLTITSGERRILSGTTLSVAGSISNSGILTTIGTLALQSGTGSSAAASTNAQTISGPGIFQNQTSGATASFGSLSFNNTNATGIIFSGSGWNSLASTVSGTLTFTAGKISFGGGIFTHGVSATSTGTLAWTSGGFTGGTLQRWIGTAAISVGTNAGNFPFVGSSGEARNYYLGTAAALTTGGAYSVTYTDAAGTTAVSSFTDNGATITRVSNANWAVSQSGLSPSSATLLMRIRGDGIATLASPSGVRITAAAGSVFTGATSGVGTGTSANPEANKTTTTINEVGAVPTLLYFGTGDVFLTVASGNWEDGTTWVGGTSPGVSCADVIVNAGHTVTVNASAAGARFLQINATGAAVVNGNTLTIGCSGKNNTLSNSGGLTVNGGNLVINGNLLSATGSSFTQSGGTIAVDGNDAGNTATSVAGGTEIVRINTSTVSLTGGTLLIVDPHASTTATTSFGYSGSAVNATGTHTVQFGDGVSTDAGGNAVGFQIHIFIGSSRLAFRNMIINGTAASNRHVSFSFTTGVLGDLSITNGGECRTGSSNTLHVGGNVSVGSGSTLTTDGTLAMQQYSLATIIPSTVAQTISGSGTFRNSTTTVTGNFANLTVNNSNAAGVTVDNLNDIASAPANAVVVSNTLLFTSGTLATINGAAVVTGTVSGGGGTLTITSGGMKAGSTYGRFWTAAETGSAISAGADPTTTTSRFPFVDAAGNNRSMWIRRTTPSGAGVLAVTYNDANTFSTVSVADGAYTVDTRYDGNWSVSNMGTTEAAASYVVHIVAPVIYAPVTATFNRLIVGSAAPGTHANGTATPGSQRTGLTWAQLSAAPVYMGINSADLNFTSKQSGNWNDANTWIKGVVPSCTDNVQLLLGHTVAVNSAGNQSQNVTVNAGATLSVSSGSLTVGCTQNNRTLTSNGVLTVSGGTLNVNGNVVLAGSSTFNQSGGAIVVDGNGTTSVASGTVLFAVNTNLGTVNGGTITIVDPPATGTARSFGYNVSAQNANWTGHTLQLGDGASTDASANVNGFEFDTYVGTGRLLLGNVIVNGGNAANRWASTSSASGNGSDIGGNLTINANAELRNVASAAPTRVGGNIVNNGILTSNVGLSLNSLSAASPVASTNPQSISGSGIFRNSTTTSTASFADLTINNTSSGGVTWNIDPQVSGTLALNASKLTLSGPSNLLTLGIDATTPGTFSYTAGVAGAQILGKFRRWITSTTGTADRAFPVGDGSNQKLASLSFTTNPSSGGTLTAQWFSGNPGFPNATALMEGAIVISSAASGYWQIDAADGFTGGIYTGTFTNNGATLSDYANAVLIKRPSAGGDWTLDGTHVTTTGSNTNPVLQRTGMNGFSQFGIGGTPGVLPVTVLAFSGQRAGQNNLLRWITTTEQNNRGFEIQRSADGGTYEVIGFVNSLAINGNSLAQLSYNFTDPAAGGPRYYYRLRQIDIDGRGKMSSIQAFYCRSLSQSCSRNFKYLARSTSKDECHCSYCRCWRQGSV